MANIRLGLIGFSEGNGHPYSWAAIFNGYSVSAMKKSGFPVISEYLAKQKFPQDRIEGAVVTHVWTQERERAISISEASLVETVCSHYTDMIGKVDGVLLARDDASSHIEIAAPFLAAGIPIYIDKPIALSVASLKTLIGMQKYAGQIFSCSALKYAKEFQLSVNDRLDLGRLRTIQGCVPNNWDKYAVHVIEPSLLLLPDRGRLINTSVCRSHDTRTLVATYSNGISVTVLATGRTPAPISLRIFGDHGWKDLVFKDAYSAFKSALEDFVFGIKTDDVRTDVSALKDVIHLLECGESE